MPAAMLSTRDSWSVRFILPWFLRGPPKRFRDVRMTSVIRQSGQDRRTNHNKIIGHCPESFSRNLGGTCSTWHRHQSVCRFAFPIAGEGGAIVNQVISDCCNYAEVVERPFQNRVFGKTFDLAQAIDHASRSVVLNAGKYGSGRIMRN